jgi:hypothetical protein
MLLEPDEQLDAVFAGETARVPSRCWYMRAGRFEVTPV